jgi:hypothetical protein
MMKITSADGVTGILCRSAIPGRYFFRVYDENYNFVDYDIAHNDLRITIHDTDAAFYERDSRHILDHAPGTLGIKT